MNAVSISREKLENILHKELRIMKISTQWVPCLLPPDQKCTRLVTSQENLTLFEAEPSGFLEHFLTQDECWLHHFEPETETSHTVETPFLIAPKTAKVSSAVKCNENYIGETGTKLTSHVDVNKKQTKDLSLRNVPNAKLYTTTMKLMVKKCG
ncbi:uncharacterized protein LOC115212274 [Octopus sinensis]|uniref:Uncharacterized protein LOC115212274 n=1 Tax=Octopus sinensis TaxID=2607531 RepID=A0A6P7SG87_9MOLL|nr:uncharacterized protein LOC115212274 [Octopus sinensis]